MQAYIKLYTIYITLSYSFDLLDYSPSYSGKVQQWTRVYELVRTMSVCLNFFIVRSHISSSINEILGKSVILGISVLNYLKYQQ